MRRLPGELTNNYCSVFLLPSLKQRFTLELAPFLQCDWSKQDTFPNTIWGKTPATLWTASVLYIVSVFSGREPVFFEQLQSVKSAEFMYFEENVGVCAGCCFDPLCSPPSVSPCGSADPPTSPQSEGAWSPGSPSSGTPPSQLLWKWVFRKGYHFLSQICNTDTDWLQESQQSTV